MRVRAVTHREDRDADADAMALLAAGRDRRLQDGEALPPRRRLARLGALSSCVVRSPDGTPLHFLSQMQDVTERRRHEAELRHLADHDPLTGLLNRRSFERELERQVAQVERYGARGAAIVLDLDHFKTINDTLGHGVGDELIARVAHALRGRLRDSDVLARLGGDEFAVLLPEGGRDEAEAVAASVLEAVRGQAVLASSGHARRVTASLGIALFTQHRRAHPRRRARRGRPRHVRGQGRRARPLRRSPTAPRPTAGSAGACRGPTRSATRSTRTASCSTRSRSSTSAPGASASTSCCCG